MKPLLQEQPSGADSRAPRAERIDAVVICSDDSLLIELGPLLGEHFRTHTLDSPADIGTAVAASRWIGIIDTASLPDARAAIARLEAQFPHCPLILFVARTGRMERAPWRAVTPWPHWLGRTWRGPPGRSTGRGRGKAADCERRRAR